MGKMRWFVMGIFAGLSAAAIDQELKKSPDERTWKGKIAGVPYNFNVPEWSSIVGEYWNTESDEIMSPHAVGIGWGVNFAAVTRRAQQLMESSRNGNLLSNGH